MNTYVVIKIGLKFKNKVPILIYGVSELCFHFKHLHLFINLELYSVKLNR